MIGRRRRGDRARRSSGGPGSAHHAVTTARPPGVAIGTASTSVPTGRARSRRPAEASTAAAAARRRSVDTAALTSPMPGRGERASFAVLVVQPDRVGAQPAAQRDERDRERAFGGLRSGELVEHAPQRLQHPVAPGCVGEQVLLLDRGGRVARVQRHELELIGLRSTDGVGVARDRAEHARRAHDRHRPRAAGLARARSTAGVATAGCGGCPRSRWSCPIRRRRRVVHRPRRPGAGRARRYRPPTCRRSPTGGAAVRRPRCRADARTAGARRAPRPSRRRSAGGSRPVPRRRAVRRGCAAGAVGAGRPTPSRPRTSSRRRRRDAPRAGVAIARIRPSRSTAMRSASPNTWSSRCDTSRIAVPAVRRSSRSRSTTSVSLTPSDAVGSSRISSAGERRTARAIATSWRWPPDNVPTGRCRSVDARWSASNSARRLRDHRAIVERHAVAQLVAEEEVGDDAQVVAQREVLPHDRDAVRPRVGWLRRRADCRRPRPSPDRAAPSPRRTARRSTCRSRSRRRARRSRPATRRGRCRAAPRPGRTVCRRRGRAGSGP